MAGKTVPQTDGATPRDRMVAAARSLFYKHGYKAVTTDMLARKAGTSKSTLYTHFGDKSGVLSAVIAKEGERFWVETHEVPQDRDGYVRALFDYGSRFLELLSDKDVRRFEHLMMSESLTHPEGARTFYERAHAATMVDLGRLIALGVEKGYIVTGYEPIELADSLSSVWRGITHAEIQLGLNTVGFTDIPVHVARGLDLVLGLKMERNASGAF